MTLEDLKCSAWVIWTIFTKLQSPYTLQLHRASKIAPFVLCNEKKFIWSHSKCNNPYNVFSSSFPSAFSSCTCVSLHLHLSEHMTRAFPCVFFYLLSLPQSHEFVKRSVCACSFFLEREWKRDWSSSLMLTMLPLIVWLPYLPLRL